MNACVGETHVPAKVDEKEMVKLLEERQRMGKGWYTAYNVFMHLVFGWPAYLLAGITGGPANGMSNHFWPAYPFSSR